MMRITSSYTSSFDSGDKLRAAWARFAGLAAGIALALTVSILGLALMLDPYDTGRFALLDRPGVRPQGPRTANASRGRDLAFDAAIIGNSHLQLLEPAALSRMTGLSFVSLATPATGPREQLVLADWFVRHRGSKARAIVFGIDARWCGPEEQPRIEQPFPFWLYDSSAFRYAAGLLRFGTLEELAARTAELFAAQPRRARPDGFWDYSQDERLVAHAAAPGWRDRLERMGPVWPVNPSGTYPAARQLNEALTRFPAGLRVVLLHPPVHVSGLAVSGSPGLVAESGCKAAFRAVAEARPGTTVVDWHVDRPEIRDAGRFFDQTHYRKDLAELVEADIAATLRSP